MTLSATLEDLAGVEARPDMPGTVDEWPNWRHPLPRDLEGLLRSPRAEALARVLGRRRKR